MNWFRGWFKRATKPGEAIRAVVVAGVREIISRFEFHAEHKLIDGGVRSKFWVTERADAEELPDIDGDGLPG